MLADTMTAWLTLALLCALALATSDALTKRALASHDEYLVAWLRLVLALPPLLIGLLMTPWPAIGPGFWRAVLLALPLELAATILYVRALKLSPLSLTLPLLALTPVFLLLFPTLLLGERLTAGGATGVALIAAGSYALNLGHWRQGLLAPLAAIAREPGCRCMFGVALLYSITSTLGKQAIGASAPLFFGAVYFTLFTAAFTPLAIRRRNPATPAPVTRQALRAMALPGLLYGVMILAHMLAISQAQVAYMIAVKRTSLLFGVLYGRLLFHEERFRERLFGAALMLAGVLLIALAG